MSFDLRTRRTTQSYGVPNRRYAKGYHRGLDKGADAGEVVRWLVSGVVTQITRNDSIGTWVETTNESGNGAPFIGYGHTRAPAGLRVGQRVIAGKDGPIVQGVDDDHGDDWDGDHVHVWTGDRSGDMGRALGTDSDPTPLFGTRPAGSGGTAFEEEETDMTGPLFYSPNTVSFPNGYTVSLPHDAWVALKSRVENPDDASMDWATQWLVDMHWTAVDFVIARAAQATAGAVIAALQAGGITIDADVDEESIARKVIAALPDPSAQAQATATLTADELAHRLGN